MRKVREAAVAGAFYESEPSRLIRDLDVLFAQVPLATANTESDLKALIVPHAGYIYSGAVAAAAYAELKPLHRRITRVVLLGPVHRVPVRGLALPGTDIFRTPLGDIEIDTDAIALISELPQVVVSEHAHALEHSLEVQLPFLQRSLDEFRLLPLAVGNASANEVAEVINLLWGGRETLFVISSDLSHFHSYEEANAIDRQTVEHILDLKPDISHEQACGGTPVNGMLRAAQQHGLRPQLLDFRNSGDTAGDKRRVVGYASFAFTSHDNDH